jgi:hypothetical protein
MCPSVDLEWGRNMTFALQRARRQVRARIVPFKAILGDANNNPYGDSGFYWVRRLDRADVNGQATTAAPFQVRAGSAIIVPRGGRVVWVGQGLDGHLTVLGFDHEDLQSVGIDARSAQPNDPYRQWLRFKDLQNFRALPVATGNVPSLKVQVRQLFYYTEDGQLTRYNGTNDSTHVDLTSDVPADELQRYVILWLRTYDPDALGDIQVTASTPIDSINDVLEFDDLQECQLAADPDTIPIQAFRLADAQTTLKLSDTVDTDLRQLVNMPHIWGFYRDILRKQRIRDNRQVVASGAVSVTTGSLDIYGDGELVVYD